MKALTYFPSQPEVQYKMDEYIEQRPLNRQIGKDIALYYQFKTQKDTINPFALIPDGCFDLLFCCCPKNSSIFLWTSPLERREQQLSFQKGCEYFGVRFQPEQGLLKLNCSMRDLLGKKIPLDEIMSVDPFLMEKILNASNFAERIELFEVFIKDITPASPSQNVVSYCINQIYLTNGNISINDLTAATGYSDRYIRKKFEETIGFSPKQFSEIVRFQNSLAMIFEKNDHNLADIVYENGYYDQAHFIKGFKKFVHLAPTQFIGSLYQHS